MKMALRMSVVVPIVTLLFLLYLLIYSSIFVRMMMRHGKTMDDFDRYLNENHLDLVFLKSLREKTEYNARTEFRNQSRFHLVSLASADEPLRKSNLKVNNGGTDMPESMSHSPVHLVSLASVSPTSPPTFPPPTPPFSTTAISSPPPPSLTQRQIQEQQLNNILEALIGAGDFVGWANLLSSADLSSLPLTATFFIPGNNAMLNHQTLGVQQNLDPLLIAYHIIPQRLSFSDLLQFKPNTRIPTLLPSKFIVVTNNSLSNFTIDGSQITHPDLYVNPAFTVHGVDKILEYSVHDAEPLLSPPVESPPMPDADVDAPTPTLKPKSVFPSYFPARGRGFIDGSDSNIPFSIEKFMVFLGVSIFLLQ
ncbi:uncharacterized protein LOC129903427 [Solanum dulcamara]|uniref:uncharacterized protein LOC129903427 n=1 Tax=Solanum dulcamara TaxID=45834 RepID=UPI0024854BC5|nr:uncharacterized protein LOC129903427 [Solanum dulcamara]